MPRATESTAALGRRFFWCAVAVLAGCTGTHSRPVPVTREIPAWAAQPVSAFLPALAGSPHDSICSDCDFSVGTCMLLNTTDRVVRVEGTSQTLLEEPECWNNNGHAMVSMCHAKVRLAFARVDPVLPGAEPDVPTESVDAVVHYLALFPDEMPNYFETGASYTLFLRRHKGGVLDPEKAPAPWSLLANCPRTTESRRRDALRDVE